jgi:uroporphyrin-III C-methyltransferase / precorrin-2 dehydrogenase / sirohydrochlorin ferrochelatase
VHALPLFVRLTGRPVILVGDGDAAAAKRRLLERAGAVIVGEDAQAALAIVAVEDDAQAEAAVSRLKTRGVLVNAVDRPALCDFTLPAILDRDPVLIAIGTGGASAGLAKALRQRLETLLPSSLGSLATTLQSARDAIRQAWPDAGDRRRAIDAGLAPGGPLDPLLAHDGSAVSVWLSRAGAHRVDEDMRTFIISHDDPDQLTVEQARLLGGADTVYHSPMIAPAILGRARADAVRIAWSSKASPTAKGATLYLVRGWKL